MDVLQPKCKSKVQTWLRSRKRPQSDSQMVTIRPSREGASWMHRQWNRSLPAGLESTRTIFARRRRCRKEVLSRSIQWFHSSRTYTRKRKRKRSQNKLRNQPLKMTSSTSKNKRDRLQEKCFVMKRSNCLRQTTKDSRLHPKVALKTAH